MTETSARNTLLESAYVSEQGALTPSNIIGAFGRCVLWPFDPAAMQARVPANVGIVPACDTTVRQEARAAAAGVLQEAQ